jgi:predicted AlkP superfamily pyrophosphatase or phosphodiesterase
MTMLRSEISPNGEATTHSQPRKLQLMSSNRNLHIFVLIDALGWEYVEENQFLNDLLSYRTPLQTVLGFSSGAIPTILTGLRPAQHGHWNLFYYDPKGSPFRWLRPLSFLPSRVMDHRVTRKIMKELGRHVLGMGPLFQCSVSPRLLPWFNWVEKRNIYESQGIPGTASIFDRLLEAGVPHRVYSYHQASDEELIRRASHDVENTDARFFFVYLSEMDAFLHMHCQEPEEVSKKLAWYEAKLRRLFETARNIDPTAGFTVLSDHGMTPVHNHFDLVGEVDRLGFSMPADYLAVYDSTMARFWFFEEKARNEVSRLLQGLKCGAILGNSELDQLGILFPDRRYGELIFLLHPTWLIAKSDFNGVGWSPRGMHGYHPEDRHSDGVFLSNRQPTTPVQAIQDVYRCMREVLA